jgi:hypothetical protein
LAASSQPLAIILVFFIFEWEQILLSESRVKLIHFIDEVVIIAAQLHECDSSAKMFAQSWIADISGETLRKRASAASLAPSGALELEWDNGKQVGVGQVIGDVFAVACLSKGRTMILTMNINPDGSLSGKWSRRTDRGTQGTETWTKT